MKYLRALWQFCSFLFVPQWGRHTGDQKGAGMRGELKALPLIKRLCLKRWDEVGLRPQNYKIIE